jgi:hypothetical protein
VGATRGGIGPNPRSRPKAAPFSDKALREHPWYSSTPSNNGDTGSGANCNGWTIGSPSVSRSFKGARSTGGEGGISVKYCKRRASGWWRGVGWQGVAGGVGKGEALQ